MGDANQGLQYGVWLAWQSESQGWIHTERGQLIADACNVRPCDIGYLFPGTPVQFFIEIVHAKLQAVNVARVYAEQKSYVPHCFDADVSAAVPQNSVQGCIAQLLLAIADNIAELRQMHMLTERDAQEWGVLAYDMRKFLSTLSHVPCVLTYSEATKAWTSIVSKLGALRRKYKHSQPRDEKHSSRMELWRNLTYYNETMSELIVNANTLSTIQ